MPTMNNNKKPKGPISTDKYISRDAYGNYSEISAKDFVNASDKRGMQKISASHFEKNKGRIKPLK